MTFKKIDDFNDLKMTFISKSSGGYISKNKYIFDKIELNPLNQFILEQSVYGTPMFKLGTGGFNILMISGIHGNELPSQIASLKLLNELLNSTLENTIYIIPFAAPNATMNNERTFNSRDLNRSAHIKNSLSNLIIQAIDELNISFVGDFHSTAKNSNPGFESVFSSRNPSPESCLIANHISTQMGSKVITFETAGKIYKGAVEDVCNLKGIPAITGEVLSPFATVGKGSVEKSFRQMKSFLDYF
ncbi:succinylglutamate desuccinylase/aspartoacylase family protein [uncultured Methanobrevibacter sp.]|uniref:succinylglutamate desuccinylase/aspartoacylase domain-containing protein n=1 Tax=uncultured Methanobrevibacter sp. TaxID=253161 RepID=UPI00260D03EA|nr:succinylglutamate desuccinylase/aspartoacylase family protein [uncultured Methanobrevibacter sp.]